MHGQTATTPLGLMIVSTMAILTMTLSRQRASIPLLITAALIPMGQAFSLFGLQFYFFRVLLLVGIVRVVIRGETRGIRRGPVDHVFIWWIVVTIVFGMALELTMGQFINRVGFAFNAVGTYLFMRCVVRDREDILRGIHALLIVAVPVALMMASTRVTGVNPLAFFGGVPELAAVRGGEIRAQGAFRHPILAGTFGATLVPLAMALWREHPRKVMVPAVGAAAAIVIVTASGSSGPMLALAGMVCAMMLWPYRHHLRTIRLAIVALVILAALMMKAPVWYLIARVSALAGGTGWHRSYLIDRWIAHFDEWWLCGTNYTAHWAPGGLTARGNPDHIDLTNHFIAEAVAGGMLKLALFVLILWKCFHIVGSHLKNGARSSDAFLVWSLGVVLFGHCLSFISVAYFDQIIVFWYWVLATIAMYGGRRQGDRRQPAGGGALHGKAEDEGFVGEAAVGPFRREAVP